MSDPSLLLLPWGLGVLDLVLWGAAAWAKRRASRVPVGVPGREAARLALRSRGMKLPVRLGRANRFILPDGIELTLDVCAGDSVASAVIAAHEAAHVVQTREMGGRRLVFPYAAGRLAFPLCVLAVLAAALTGHGVPTALAISLASTPLVLFVVLVEVDADRRALGLLDEIGLLRDPERRKTAVLLIRARTARLILWALVPIALSLWLAQVWQLTSANASQQSLPVSDPSTSIWNTAGMVAMALAVFFLIAQIVYLPFLYLGPPSLALAMIFWLIERWVGRGQRRG